MALGAACEEDASTIDEAKLRQAFRYYRHRFRYKRHFGQVTWLMQTFAKWWRLAAYCRSFAQAVTFLDRLIIQDRDQSILPNFDWARGGLRQGLYYSEVRTDFVQHSLSELLEFTPHLEGHKELQKAQRI